MSEYSVRQNPNQNWIGPPVSNLGPQRKQYRNDWTNALLRTLSFSFKWMVESSVIPIGVGLKRRLTYFRAWCVIVWQRRVTKTVSSLLLTTPIRSLTIFVGRTYLWVGFMSDRRPSALPLQEPRNESRHVWRREAFITFASIWFVSHMRFDFLLQHKFHRRIPTDKADFRSCQTNYSCSSLSPRISKSLPAWTPKLLLQWWTCGNPRQIWNSWTNLHLYLYKALWSLEICWDLWCIAGSVLCFTFRKVHYYFVNKMWQVPKWRKMRKTSWRYECFCMCVQIRNQGESCVSNLFWNPTVQRHEGMNDTEFNCGKTAVPEEKLEISDHTLSVLSRPGISRTQRCRCCVQIMAERKFGLPTWVAHSGCLFRLLSNSLKTWIDSPPWNGPFKKNSFVPSSVPTTFK